jgi:hypothetical protein
MGSLARQGKNEGRNIVVSFRDISTVVMINRQTGVIYWKLSAPPLAGQHAPYILPNGHLLLFDNGPHRLDQSLPFSRVLEIDPATKQIVWKYQDTLSWLNLPCALKSAIGVGGHWATRPVCPAIGARRWDHQRHDGRGGKGLQSSIQQTH